MIHGLIGLRMGPPPGGIFYVDSNLGLNWGLLDQPDNIDAEVDIAELEVHTADSPELEVDIELEVDKAELESEPSLDKNDPHRMASQRRPCNTGMDLEIPVVLWVQNVVGSLRVGFVDVDYVVSGWESSMERFKRSKLKFIYGGRVSRSCLLFVKFTQKTLCRTLKQPHFLRDLTNP